LKYVRRLTTGRLEYRRAFPKALWPHLGRRELIRSLEATEITDPGAMERYFGAVRARRFQQPDPVDLYRHKWRMCLYSWPYRQKTQKCLYMAKEALTPTEQTLFAELVQQVATAVPAGTVYTREREGIQYYYAKVPVGVDRIDTFIGKVGDDEAEAKVAELKRGMEQARERRRLVSLLRRTGLAAPHRTIGALIGAAAQGRHGWREPILRSLTELKKTR
jgi:hypothetical protein